MQETLVQFLGQKDPRRRDGLPTLVFLGFLGGSAGKKKKKKKSACIKGDLGLISGLGRSPGIVESSDKMWFTGEGNGNPLQWPCLENPRDGGA